MKVPLMLDAADAAYASDDKRDQSQQLYTRIFTDFPNHPLAATALYNAAFSAMESANYSDAILLTRQFERKYPESDYLPDAIEVLADSLLLAKKYAEAETEFKKAIERFPGHPKSPIWKLRTGLSLYLQQKHEEVVQWLSPVTEQLSDENQKAEALHWIGSSQFQLGDAKAVETLQNAFRSSSSWRRADETLLHLSRAFYQEGRPEDALATTRLLISSFPDSSLIAESNYRLGEFEYEAGNYERAIDAYVAVIDANEKSEFSPYALNGIGWANLDLKRFELAAESFTQLIDSFPNHALAVEARIGRGSAFRQFGRLTEAIKDLELYLADEKANKKMEATYELGLAQIGQEDWPTAIQTLAGFLKSFPDSKLADRVHYELGWASKSSQQTAAAVEHFRAITEKFSTSPLAAEAFFHVAQDAYAKEDFGRAIEMFNRCIADCEDNAVKEKAIYKLAWSHFKTKDYSKALELFRQQVSEFPDGALHADAMFMVSESLYETNQYREAFNEYRVAKPVIETSKTVSPNLKILTYLHGAQSANLAGEHEQAIEFAEALIAMEVDSFVRQDAQMELGDARRALKQDEAAIAAYELASRHPGKTGARSMCMVGEILFDGKKFADAINKFKIVLYGYGGVESDAEIKPWQAFAAYEAARCNLVQVSKLENTEPVKRKLIAESIKHFEYLLANYPDDRLAPEARKQLDRLKSLD